MLALRSAVGDRSLLLVALTVISVIVVIAGVISYGGGIPQYWSADAGREVVAFSAGYAAVAALVWFALKRAAPSFLLLLTFIYLIVGVGILPSLFAMLFLLSTALAGHCAYLILLRSRASLLDCLAVGAALQIAMLEAIIHFPINNFVTHLLLEAAPLLVLLRPASRAATFRTAAALRLQLSKTARSIPYGWLTAATLLVTIVLRCAFFPTIGSDDLGQHLRLWSELSWHGYFSFDVVSQVGAVSPATSDLIHASLSLLAGTDARPAENLFFVLLLIGLVWALSGRFTANARDRVICVVLFASTPMLANLLTTLQQELVLALFTALGTLIVLRAVHRPSLSSLVSATAVAACCMATKLPGTVIAALLFLSCLVLCWRGDRRLFFRTPMQLVGGAVLALLFLFTAVETYAFAWIHTGNPVFPFYNAVFKSPLFKPANFVDGHWQTGITRASVWGVFFQTQKYFEGAPFTAGFQYLFLPMIGALAALLRRRYLPLLICCVISVGFAAVMFTEENYWRYLFPALPAISAVCAAALLIPDPTLRTIQRVAFVALAGINLWLLPGILWFLSVPPSTVYGNVGRTAIEHIYAPEVLLNQFIDHWAPGSRVMFPVDHSYGATLHGKPIYLSWYAPKYSAVSLQWQSGADVRSFVADQHVDFTEFSEVSPLTDPRVRYVEDYLSLYGYPLLQAGAAILYRNSATPITFTPAFDLGAARWAAGQATDLVATGKGQVVGRLSAPDSRAVRYNVNFTCDAQAGWFVAEILWDSGAPYYRLVPCALGGQTFSETIPIPPSASIGTIEVATRATASAIVKSLSVEAAKN